ncbi:hypothetical protein [Fontivita pretiosa]|uniref:hypothetical protein n=1 Tax=Fontivita pretiosa TaxID=2989684 RepID=UPI003D17856F
MSATSDSSGRRADATAERCSHCGINIPPDRPAMIWRERVVCELCYDYLATRSDRAHGDARGGPDVLDDPLAMTGQPQPPIDPMYPEPTVADFGSLLAVVAGWVLLIVGFASVLIGTVMALTVIMGRPEAPITRAEGVGEALVRTIVGGGSAYLIAVGLGAIAAAANLWLLRGIYEHLVKSSNSRPRRWRSV